MSNTTDSRSTHTDALATLGSIINDTEKRDAIHLAVEPVFAATDLKPGDHVGFVEGGIGKCDKPVGIVDPFLKKKVKKGERFWLIVYPRQITSLRHVWSHPDFPDTSEVESIKNIVDSEQWLRDFCDRSDCPGYDTIIDIIRKDLNGEEIDSSDLGYDYGGWGYLNGEYLHFSGRDAHGVIPDEFWDHVEIVLGQKIPNRKKATYFSCSC